MQPQILKDELCFGCGIQYAVVVEVGAIKTIEGTAQLCIGCVRDAYNAIRDAMIAGAPSKSVQRRLEVQLPKPETV